MPLTSVTLEDKYTVESGRIFLSGVQAAVRLPMMQRRRDRAGALNTGGFISGYRGSPLGGYDHALGQARELLDGHDIHFQPGINEDLAATSVWGSQQVNLFPDPLVDGVFAIWYGKGPGVDRSTDVLKHGNAAGSSAHGGVLVMAGDDHGCQSSTLPHQSEPVLQAAMIPILNPATVQEVLDFGLVGFALSRYSGCWVGFKAVSETFETSATVLVDPGRIEITLPGLELPPGGLNIRWPDPALDQERRLHGPKMDAVAAFARVNRFDRLIFDPPRARLGIFTTGKAYLDVRQALVELGLDGASAVALGIRLYKVGLTWPLEADGARRFADGLEEVLVVEEKRGFIEDQLVRVLYHLAASRRPRVVGKRDERGAELLPSAGEVTPTIVARVLLERLVGLGLDDPALAPRLARLETLESAGDISAGRMERTPFFCSGCPHNTSTRIPAGSRALAGIGCHGMVMQIPKRNSTTDTHMGGEGATWIGQSPFTAERHVFQNLGDGTYQHSGLLAVRAAAAAGVNITYKILFNHAVAMTGGQTVEGSPSVADIARQVAAEGAKKVVVITNEPEKYPRRGYFADGVAVHHRDSLDHVQRALREIPGLTVLLYDQTCAAELRRRRKRGLEPEPSARVVINEAVCEGCGDCSDQANCISIKPVETVLGRKRTIDQSSCNVDLSCLRGYCPSFVTVYGGRLRHLHHPDPAALTRSVPPVPPPPSRVLTRPWSVLITGIGGTGIITQGALLGMASHLEGKACTVLDLTGLAQKNGAVMSHVRLARDPADLHAPRIAAGGADLVIGCDLVVATSASALGRMDSGKTRAIINRHLEPTAEFVLDGDTEYDVPGMEQALGIASDDGNVEFIDATRAVTALMGDDVTTNSFLLGYAFQQGLIPLSLEALERAIELNGIAVEANLRSLAWGRFAAHDRLRFDAILAPMAPAEAPEPVELPSLVTHRASLLVAYQSEAYARRYREYVEAVVVAEHEICPGATALATAVARGLYKLMAYKDEYEVARLYTDGSFAERLERQFEGDYRLEFHLAPPWLSPRDRETGQASKRAYGPWVVVAFRLLARLRSLRGTPLDPFRHRADRRMERRLILEYESVMREILDHLSPGNHAQAVEIARLAERIRGFGQVKERAVVEVKGEEARLLRAFRKRTTADGAAK